MPVTTADILYALGLLVLVGVMFAVVRARRRDKAAHDQQYSIDNVCPHLKPALETLLARGHRVVRAGQHHPDLPLEIHLEPAFSPQALYDELKLAEPVFVSERNVLYCKEDWCELHPPR